MGSLREFFDRQGERFGPFEVTSYNEEQAMRLRQAFEAPESSWLAAWRLAAVPVRRDGPRPRALELNCGSGATMVACARHGFEMTAIEISPVRAGYARTLAAAERENRPDVRVGDFMTADLGGGYDAVTYWSGFGQGDDADQRALLRRVAREWLAPGGRMVVEVSNPTWWARMPLESTRHDDLDSWQGTRFDAVTGCRVDLWWTREDRSDTISQAVRCYRPPDLALLLEGTGLRIEGFEAEGIPGLSEIEDAELYLTILGHE